MQVRNGVYSNALYIIYPENKKFWFLYIYHLLLSVFLYFFFFEKIFFRCCFIVFFCFYFVFIFDVKKENVYIIKSLINYDFKNT